MGDDLHNVELIVLARIESQHNKHMEKSEQSQSKELQDSMNKKMTMAAVIAACT